MIKIKDLTDLQVYSLTLIGEFSSGGQKGMAEIACVVQNRKRANKWWGKTERDICLFKWQFSCWNDTPNNNNRSRLLTMDFTKFLYRTAEGIAKAAIGGALPDSTNGATHYFNHLLIPPPVWPKWYTRQPGCYVNEPHWYFDLSSTG